MKLSSSILFILILIGFSESAVQEATIRVHALRHIVKVSKEGVVRECYQILMLARFAGVYINKRYLLSSRD